MHSKISNLIKLIFFPLWMSTSFISETHGTKLMGSLWH